MNVTSATIGVPGRVLILLLCFGLGCDATTTQLDITTEQQQEQPQEQPVVTSDDAPVPSPAAGSTFEGQLVPISGLTGSIRFRIDDDGDAIGSLSGDEMFPSAFLVRYELTNYDCGGSLVSGEQLQTFAGPAITIDGGRFSERTSSMAGELIFDGVFSSPTAASGSISFAFGQPPTTCQVTTEWTANAS